MKTILNTAETMVRFLVNKAALIVLLVLLMIVYKDLPEGVPVPYSEVLYCAVLILAEVLAAAVVRMLVFPEAAYYAECGKLRRDVSNPGVEPAIKHYWFATALSHAVTIFTLAHLISNK